MYGEYSDAVHSSNPVRVLDIHKASGYAPLRTALAGCKLIKVQRLSQTEVKHQFATLAYTARSVGRGFQKGRYMSVVGMQKAESRPMRAQTSTVLDASTKWYKALAGVAV